MKIETTKTYKIEIQELLSRVIEIEAQNQEEAISKIKELYQKEKIVLDASNYVENEVKTYKE